MQLSQLAVGRDNNLNLLRFAAASLVLLSHCWPLTQGTDANEPAMRLFGVELGRMAVWVFFSVSGFLVAASQERRPGLKSFALARIRRIFPGLIVMLLILVFLLGPAFTTLPLGQYFSHRHTWAYLLYNSTLYELRWALPGVFNGAALNGSLWTLPAEVRCYIVLGLLGWAGALRYSATYAVLACVFIVLLYTGSPDIVLAISFLVGAAAWRWKQHVRLHGGVALALLSGSLVLMYLRLPLADAALAVALAYGSLYLAYVPSGRVRFFNRFGDYSFGIYIYAFPVQVTLHHLAPDVGVFGMFCIAMPVTLVLAMLSWHFIESPALHARASLKPGPVGRVLEPPAAS